MRNHVRTALLAGGLALGALPAAGFAARTGALDAGGIVVVHGGRASGGAADDVRLGLRVARRNSPGPVPRIRLKNRGSNSQRNVLVELRADSDVGELLGSWTLDLDPGAAASIRVRVTPPPGTARLVATATLDGVPDGNPDDNTASADLGPSWQAGAGDPSGGGGGATELTAAQLGLQIYASNCAVCHGALGGGTREGPRVVGRSTGDIWEAIHEGEEGMPTFPGLTLTDVRNVSAFLGDPASVSLPPPPPPPPPGTPPTYTGQVKALLDANCKACHAGASAFAGVKLDTYANASANASLALAAVQAGRMPQGGPLTAADIQVLADWVAGGTPK